MNRLTVIGPVVEGRREFMVFRCSCGVTITRTARSVKTGRVKSCGCWNAEATAARNFVHGRAPRGRREPEYVLWQGMKARCFDPKNKAFKYYGGRGITVCDEWARSYVAFLSGVGRRPGRKMSLDRIDNDGNYEPGNVRWATQSEQLLNRRQLPRKKRLVLPPEATDDADAVTRERELAR